MKKHLFFLLFIFLLSPLSQETSSGENIPSDEEKTESPYSVFSSERESQKINASTGESGNLRFSQSTQPLFSKTLPPYSGQALADFILAIRQDFVEFAGSGQGKMSRSQFEQLVSAGKLPSKDSAGEYFDSHDKDKDGALTISEFTPTASELLHNFALSTITECFMKGLPYPNKSLPLGSVFFSPEVSNSSQKPPLFLTSSEIEQRIKRFAQTIGGETSKGADGRLYAKDASGNTVPLPPGLIPMGKGDAEQELRTFAGKIGGSFESGTDGFPVVKNSSGDPVPVYRWPPRLRPPYLPPRN